MSTTTSKRAQAIAGALAASATLVGGAHAQNTFGTPQELLELVPPNRGFNMETVHGYALRAGISGEMRTSSEGKRYAAMTSPEGINFVMVPEFCESGTCLGLVFVATFTTASNYGVGMDGLNAFNLVRPHGNAAYLSQRDEFVIQRVITNISGITVGSLAAEMGVFRGYSSTFREFIRTASSKVSISNEVESATPQTKAVSIALSPLTFGQGDPTIDVVNLFADIEQLGRTDGMNDPVE